MASLSRRVRYWPATDSSAWCAAVAGAAVDATVTELLAGGPMAQREIKQLYAQLATGPISDAVRELTAQTISRVRGTDEAREGFTAFLDKRHANWIPHP